MWFTPAARLPAAIHPAPQAPPCSGSRALEREAAWPEPPTGVQGKDRRNCGGFLKALDRSIELLLAWYVRECTILADS